MPSQQTEDLKAKKQLKDGCVQAKRGPALFVYCPSGTHSTLVLLVEKWGQVKTRPIVRTAKKKRVTGSHRTYEGSSSISSSNRLDSVCDIAKSRMDGVLRRPDKHEDRADRLLHQVDKRLQEAHQ